MPSRTKRLRILLMEDDAGLARLCLRKLEKAGYVVDHAADGEEGLKIYDAQTHDAIVMDHSMPVYDGLDVVRKLASKGHLPPIIMVTGAGNEQIAVEAMKLGVLDYIVKDTDGGYLVLLPAVIKRVLHAHRLEGEKRLATKVFERATEGILITDINAKILSTNEALGIITGYSSQELIGKNPSILKSGRHDDDFYKKMWQTLIDTDEWQGEIWNRRKNGEAYPAWLAINTVKDEQEQTTHYVGFFLDITALKQGEEYLRHLATHDALTNLPNRNLLQDHSNRILAMANREKQNVAIMLLDLDHFKQINDNYGHAVGDQVLISTAERLKQCMRDCDIVARLGGDEFAIILAEISDPKSPATLTKRLLLSIGKPLVIDKQEHNITASIGISLYPTDGDNFNILLTSADAAMYKAKEKRNCYRFYSKSP